MPRDELKSDGFDIIEGLDSLTSDTHVLRRARHPGWVVTVNEKLQLPNVYIRRLTDVRNQHPAIKNSAGAGRVSQPSLWA